ncbi:hypothetical protein S7S_13120 [Isoalcanivorax pacificus W11-5]|uniref:Transmembrane protein n=1 Tax=Isoalcanivorax pacificus W11-5 TaxID=391936 RepID=A0A0B4XPG6_9GAMM|nr:hypothetical protein [Isoalcanivorax pacificus]AJD49036.1 hypothetical protein S7S_13120 [Isoalcanivorax pacificus W11-5]
MGVGVWRLLWLCGPALLLLGLNVLGARLPTAVLGLAWLLLSAVIAAGLWRRALSRRQAFVQAYILPQSRLARWLRGGWLLRLRQWCVALLLGLVLLVGVIRLEDGLAWWVLLGGLLLLAVCTGLAERYLGRHVTPVYLPALSMRVALWSSFVALLCLMTIPALFSHYPDFQHISLIDALWSEAGRQHAVSEPLLWLLQAAAMKDALAWWLGQQWLPGLGEPLFRYGGWLVLLAADGLFLLALLMLGGGTLARLPAPPPRRGVLLALPLVLLATLLVADHRATLRAQWLPAAPVTVALGGKVYQVPAARAQQLALLSALRFTEGEAGARSALDRHLTQGLDRLFAQLEAQLPTFADWYYSLGGEYARLSMMMLEQNSGDYLQEKALELIYEPVGFAQQVDILRLQADGTLLRAAEDAREAWLAEMIQALTGERAGQGPASAPVSLDLDTALGELDRYSSPAFMQRMSVAGGAATATAGVVLFRAFAARAAARSGAALAARGAAKGAARAGAAAGAGTGAALCAPTGPGALACALAGGVVSWVATDWALLKIDEYANRDELIADLRASLAEERLQLEAQWRAAYDTVIAAQYGGMREDIQRTFSPGRAVRDA